MARAVLGRGRGGWKCVAQYRFGLENIGLFFSWTGSPPPLAVRGEIGFFSVALFNYQTVNLKYLREGPPEIFISMPFLP